MGLVERADLLAALWAHLEHAERGTGRSVLLRGEAGIGKTAAVRRFVDQARARARVLVGACDPVSTPSPLSPLLDMVGELAPRVAEALSGTTGPTRVARELLADLAAQHRPTVLALEDLHWADGATLDLLRILGRRIESLPVLLLGTYRDDEVGPRHPLMAALGDLAGCAGLHRVDVPPLSAGGVVELAAGRAVDPAQLYRITAGNPFFVTEALAWAADTVPASVSEAVLGRLARSTVAARAVAEAVAVLGSPADPRLVEALVPQAEAALADAFAAGLLHPGRPGIAFRHELARLAVWESIPHFRRTGLHARVLALLGERPVGVDDLARLAYHAEQAGDLDAVLRYAPAAAEHAAARGAHAEAAAQYARALRHAHDQPRELRARLLEGHALVSYLGALVPEALESGRLALELRRELGDKLREAENLRWLSHTLWPCGLLAESRQACREAMRVLAHLPPSRQQLDVLLEAAAIEYADSHLDAANALAEQAIGLGERLGDPPLVDLARLHAQVVQAARGNADWRTLEATLDAVIDAGMHERAAFISVLVAWLAIRCRDATRTEPLIARAERYCDDHGLSYHLLMRAFSAFAMLYRGSWADAAAAANDILAHPASSLPLLRVFPLTVLGQVRARRGDPEVWPLLDEAAGLVEPTTLLHLGPLWEARAEAAWLCGDHSRAVVEASTGLKLVTAYSDPWVAGGLARWVHLAGGRPPHTPAAEPFARELAGDWRGAAASWEERGCAYDAALARLGGDVAAAGQALETFESLEARPAAARARARLRELGVRVGSRRPRSATRAHSHGLTARQAEILDLVAAGLTDAQIAARLHLSPKTVNRHVTDSLAKLGVHTRADAVRALAD